MNNRFMIITLDSKREKLPIHSMRVLSGTCLVTSGRCDLITPFWFYIHLEVITLTKDIISMDMMDIYRYGYNVFAIT